MTLKQMREAVPMSQTEVAKELDVTTTTIYKWETGRASPQPQYVRGLARVYGRTIQEVQDAIEESKRG